MMARASVFQVVTPQDQSHFTVFASTLLQEVVGKAGQNGSVTVC